MGESHRNEWCLIMPAGNVTLGLPTSMTQAGSTLLQPGPLSCLSVPSHRRSNRTCAVRTSPHKYQPILVMARASHQHNGR